MKEVEWGGRMFGAFTKSETELLRHWWSSTDTALPPSDPKGAYHRYTGQTRNATASPQMIVHPHPLDDPSLSSLSQAADLPIVADSAARLFSLWKLSTTLLERLPLSPARLATHDGMIALRILRAQLGYSDLHDTDQICAGIDDAVADRVIDLAQISHPIRPRFLTQADPSDQVAQLADQLRLRRTRPYANLPWLFGVISGLEAWLYSDHAAIETVKDTDHPARCIGSAGISARRWRLGAGRGGRQAIPGGNHGRQAVHRLTVPIVAHVAHQGIL